MIPSEWAAVRAGRGEVRVGQRRPDDPAAVGASRAGPARGRTGAAGRPAWSGRAAARCPTSGAPAATSAAETRERPRRRVGVGEGRRVHDDAGHQRGGERTVAGVERRRRGRPASSATISHVAAAPGSIQSAVADAVVRGVVVDDRRAAAARTARRGGRRRRPIRSSEPQSRDDEQVVGAVRVRVGAEALDAGHEVVQRRHRVGADRRRRAPPSASTSRHDAERRAERVGVRVLVADRQHAPGAAQPVDDDLRDGGEVRRRGRRVIASAFRGRLARAPCRASSAACPAGATAAAAATGARTADGGSSVEVVGLVDARRPASAATRSAAGRASGRLARLELVEQLEDPGAALGRVVEADVELRDPPDPQPLAQLVADERHRVARARRRAASRSAGWPMTLTQTLAWRRSGVVSTSVIVTNPIRGSATSRAMIAPISWRSSSSTRSVRWLIGVAADRRRTTTSAGARD